MKTKKPTEAQAVLLFKLAADPTCVVSIHRPGIGQSSESEWASPSNQALSNMARLTPALVRGAHRAGFLDRVTDRPEAYVVNQAGRDAGAAAVPYPVTLYTIHAGELVSIQARLSGTLYTLEHPNSQAFGYSRTVVQPEAHLKPLAAIVAAVGTAANAARVRAEASDAAQRYLDKLNGMLTAAIAEDTEADRAEAQREARDQDVRSRLAILRTGRTEPSTEAPEATEPTRP